ncbi:branched-chain amino acid ABC transporter permease [Nesterenkonia pannonica]|uniref:branched-chain amino acid ABC transporter permease n=1 Tax=Nesterenkonia pannonica TaxID=1548602 RepID=UPI002164A327|nr:branched-chain amino acid ABC transporter permease [Nesterenkonia pannonica]
MSSARFAGRIRRGHILTIAIVAVGIAATPFALTPYPLALLTLALAYGLFAFGLDLTWGRAGVVSIGHAAFFGIGAYGVAIATDNDQHMLLGALAGIAISVLVALAIGRIGLGSKTLPSTMAILTLAATLLAQQVALSWRGTTGGSNGIFVASSGVVPDFYRTAAVVFVVVICVWFFVIRGQWGRRFRAVQSNEIRAAHLGIDPRQTKVISFCLSAAVAAIAGCWQRP